MEEEARIRSAGLKDLNSLILISSSLNYHEVPLSYLIDKNLQKLLTLDYRHALTSRNYKILLAEKAKKPVAFIYGYLIHFHGARLGMINELAIFKEHKLKRWFEKRGCQEIHVEINIKNKLGSKFYSSLGFLPWEYRLRFPLK